MFFSHSKPSIRYFVLPIMAFTLLFTFFAFASPTSADGGATVKTTVTDAPNGAFAEDEVMILTLNIEGVSDLHATEFIFNFNPAEMQIIDTDANKAGTQIEAGNCTSNDLNINLVENTTGVVRYASMYLRPAPANRSPSCVMASIPFKLQEGVSAASIEFDDMILLNSSEQIDVNAPGTMYVPSTPTAISLTGLEATQTSNPFLLLVGMIGMALLSVGIVWQLRRKV